MYNQLLPTAFCLIVPRRYLVSLASLPGSVSPFYSFLTVRLIIAYCPLPTAYLSPPLPRLPRRSVGFSESLLQPFLNFNNSPLQLGVNSFCHRREVFLHGNVGVYSMTFLEPGSIEVIHPESGNRDVTAIHEIGYAADTDQPAPGAGADQGPQSCLAEVVRKSIATRSAPAIDQHHFRSIVGILRPGPGLAVADRPIHERRAVEHLNKPVWNLSSVIESFVNDHRLLIPLRIELADQFTLSVNSGTPDIYIARFTVGSVLYTFPVFLNPFQMAEPGFILERLYDGCFGSLRGRRCVKR